MRRPQASQWTPVSDPADDAATSVDAARPAPAPGGPFSFRDFLGPVRAGSPSEPAAVSPAAMAGAPALGRADAVAPFGAASDSPFPTTVEAPPERPAASLPDAPQQRPASPFRPVSASPFGPVPGAPAADAPGPEPAPSAPKRAPRRRLAVPRLLDRRLALVAAVVVGLAAGVGANAVSGLVREAGATSDVPPPTPQQCAAIQAAWTNAAASQVGMTADDPASLRTGFLGARDALDGVVAPSGAAADWDLVATYLGTVAAAVEPVDPADGAAVTAAVGTALAGLDTPAVTAASARVTAYLKSGCTG
ncbi:hypothetical protein [Xylanimonas protaetiae]|uniref:Uncharacterized protein n=1 Tax=Xylanimonas protaetiae TaxID=2509457 RepID=A0A4P6F924_9MICO|nr:hypothetical protein [Xylanimonas protaetiae]QAY69837.1 hypothetical protein ET471_07115 [Xylanimonas protaetiae]